MKKVLIAALSTLSLAASASTTASPAPTISISPSAYTYTVGTRIAPITPVVTGAVSVAVSPSIANQTGLTYDGTTGVISGTPSSPQKTTTYTLTAVNSAGKKATASVTVTVNDLAPTISIAGGPFSFLVGAKIEPIVPLLGPSVISVGILPKLTTTGLSFNTNNGKITGTPTAPEPATIYTLTASNVTGQTASTQISIYLKTVVAAAAPPPAAGPGCEYTLNIADFQSTSALVTRQRVFAGATELFPGVDGFYHVPLTDLNYGPIVDRNGTATVLNGGTLPVGVWEVNRKGTTFTAGNSGHQNDSGLSGYVSYVNAATVNCNIVKVVNVKGVDGFEDEADGIGIVGDAGDDQYTVTGNVITAESSTTTAADLYTVTYSDVCEGVLCTASDQCHVAGTCDPESGLCSDPAAADGTACTDGDACTQTDTCQAGVCTGSDPVICTASDQCHVVGTCAPATGLCSNPSEPDGTTCNDGKLCTANDICTAGACAGAPVTCNAEDQCHSAGSCDPTSGQCSNPPLADGSSCTLEGAPAICSSGTCMIPVPPSTVVTSATDSGPGSLRAVLAAAPPGSTLVFDPSLNGQTITLLSTIGINNNVTIAGPGASQLTLSGGGAVQILSVNSGDVSISGLTFANGNSAAGGAIVNWATLAISASSFTSNLANNGSGGAIENYGTLSVDGSSFTSNNAQSGNGANGGAIMSYSGSVALTASTFTSNSAVSNGGAIGNGGALSIAGCTFTSNSATQYSGGALWNFAGSIAVESSTFASNSGYYVGAIFVSAGDVTVTNSTFYGNVSVAGQGGAVMANGGTTTLISVTAAGNVGEAAIRAQDTSIIQIEDSLISGNDSGDVEGIWGGAVNSLGYNLVGNSSGFVPAATDLLGIDPMLSALGNYGGPTQTLLPAAQSPAVNAIPAASCVDTNGAPLLVDQRGDPRPAGAGGNCTIGADERQPSDAICSGAATNLFSDANNCGDCGISCGSGSCVNGACILGACTGFQVLPGTGVFVPPASCSGSVRALVVGGGGNGGAYPGSGGGSGFVTSGTVQLSGPTVANVGGPGQSSSFAGLIANGGQSGQPGDGATGGIGGSSGGGKWCGWFGAAGGSNGARGGEGYNLTAAQEPTDYPGASCSPLINAAVWVTLNGGAASQGAPFPLGIFSLTAVAAGGVSTINFEGGGGGGGVVISGSQAKGQDSARTGYGGQGYGAGAGGGPNQSCGPNSPTSCPTVPQGAPGVVFVEWDH